MDHEKLFRQEMKELSFMEDEQLAIDIGKQVRNAILIPGLLAGLSITATVIGAITGKFDAYSIELQISASLFVFFLITVFYMQRSVIQNLTVKHNLQRRFIAHGSQSNRTAFVDKANARFCLLGPYW